MACIERRPKCGTTTSEVIPEPITEISSIISSAGTIIGIISILGIFEVEGGELIIKIFDTIIKIGGAGGGAAIAGLAVYIGILILIGWYVSKRCEADDGLPECVAGVVHEIEPSFSSALDELLPFTAMHDRVDIVVKSRFWDLVEAGNAKVFCTDAVYPRRSEIFRSYYYTKRVCKAGSGALIGASVAGAVGVYAGIAAAAAIGCAVIWLCLLVIILAVIIVAASALTGALVGGQIAKAVTGETAPDDYSGNILAVGNYITVNGNMVTTEFAEGANIFYWEKSTFLHGNASDNLARPFNYCDVDDEFTEDSCPIIE